MTKTIHEIENNLQTDHFKPLPNKENEEGNKVFDLVLVDIKNSLFGIECVKKNMYDTELKYICISYRWGELNEQQLETPDYTAHITSFDLRDIRILCNFIKKESDLKDIDYLWIDAISVDQQNYSRKKDTILKMSEIYQNAAYILAVPDLHREYLLKNTANMEILYLINEHKETIYKEIFNNKQSDNDSINKEDDISVSITLTSQSDTISEQLSNNDNQYSFIQKLTIEKLLKRMEKIEVENKELKKKMKKKEEEKRKYEKGRIYQFLSYLIEDWSNRAWVISEYHIAKDKYKKIGTPLKYIFITLLDFELDEQLFFSYHFNDDEQQSTMNNKVLDYRIVSNPILFYQFVKSRFMQRSHLDMILNSNATRNEDRFNAILPSWNKYNDIITNKNTIPDWNVSDMTSVRLKLYEIMGLWDKATLLHACKGSIILPTFASNYDNNYLKIIEKVDYNNSTYKRFEESLLEYTSNYADKKKRIKMKQLMDEYKMNSNSIWNENLISIQFEPHHRYLSVKSKSYFITNVKSNEKEYWRNKLSLHDDDEIHCVFVPFFTSNLPGYIDYLDIYKYGSKIFLVGNRKKKMLLSNYFDLDNFRSEHFCTDDYTFNIY